MRPFHENRFVLGGLLWTLLWIIPWAIWLGSLPWIRLGISIIVFAIPGMGISLLLVGKQFGLSTHFTSGLAISVLLVGSLGLIGRLFSLPFKYISPAFALTGLIVLIVLINHSRSERQLYKPNGFSTITLALLVFMFALGIVVNFQDRLEGDDMSYLAHLTNWQYAQPLSFREVIFGSGSLDPIRFWFAMFPMTLALLAEMSNLHGVLLLGVYLEPYLVAIGILTIYNLYEDFLKEKYVAIAATLLHFTFFVLLQGGRQPGSTFFFRLSEDKAFAAFILAPVFFLAIRHFLESFTWRRGIFVFLIGFSLTLTHPVILAYSLFIAGLYASIVTMIERNYKKFGVSMALFIITVLPVVFLRFIDGPSTTRYAVNLQLAIDAYGDGETRFSYIEGTPFYGFDLQRIQIQTAEPEPKNLLQIFFSWSYLWLLGVGFLWSLFNLKKKTIAPFVTATSALVLLCGIPYTGWLLGYFVSAGMLWRSPWLMPIGLIGIVLVADLVEFVSQKVTAKLQSKPFREPFILGLTSVLCIVLIAFFLVGKYNVMLPAILDQTGYKKNMERLVVLGDYLESNIKQPSIFVAPLKLMNYLPGLSSKAKVVFFRTSRFTPHAVDMDKIELVLSPQASIPIKQRLQILKQYNVQYILIDRPALKNYYARYAEFFKVQKINDFWIIELEDSSS
jgi:hypothetical protein